ncbi:pancreatic secretory granule membrane major glycoprotein GP2-like isoform X2 [Sebastes fasciatus]|uniref:pancreatic secretory granule membrane major glycoprotein GP2-like isoform X2 n=1 Tax=Sebastes fasciatus TaxID=394691 RepID=UPI003D9DECB7
MKQGALLLLLAVAASQVDLNLSDPQNIVTGHVNISMCPITFYGRTYSMLDLLIQDSVLSVCLKNDAAENATACLSMGDNGNATKVGWGIKTTSTDRSDIIKGSELPQLVSSSQCHIALKTNGPDGDYAELKLFNFGAQTAAGAVLMISDHFSMSAMVNDSAVDSWAISKAVLNGSEFFMDLSGCRLSDVTLAADSEKLNPGTCLKEVCDKHAVASTVSSCGAKEVCQDNVKCGIQHNDTIDSSINCNRSTEHCNLMRQAPFTACHDRIDPELYITACTNTLCNYPAVDGLNCQLLEAYAKACSLKDVTLKDWRSTVGCSGGLLPGSCHGLDCSRHEFCGEHNGGSACLCRAMFASKYKPKHALGEPAVCMQNSATVTLAGCLLLDKGIDYSVLHLKDPSCAGDMDNETHMISFSFNSSNNCGTEVMTNNSQILCKNTIMVRNSTLNGVITRHDQVEIDFSCLYQMPDIRNVSFRINDSSVVQKIQSGVWNYTLIMSAYTDPSLTQLIKPNTEIQLNQTVWLELKEEELDDDMVAVVTDSCWATSQVSPNSSLRYDLVINKCPNPADKMVRMEGNGEGTSNSFSFNVFEFSGQSPEFYLHCQVELCSTQGQTCAPSCGKRRRRSSKSKLGESALITMAWSN